MFQYFTVHIFDWTLKSLMKLIYTDSSLVNFPLEQSPSRIYCACFKGELNKPDVLCKIVIPCSPEIFNSSDVSRMNDIGKGVSINL